MKVLILAILTFAASAQASQTIDPANEFFRMRYGFDNSAPMTKQEELGFESVAEVLARAAAIGEKGPYVQTATLYKCEKAVLDFGGEYGYYPARNEPCNGICPGGPTGYSFMYDAKTGKLTDLTIGRIGHPIQSLVGNGYKTELYFRANWTGSIFIEEVLPLMESLRHGNKYFHHASGTRAHTNVQRIVWSYMQCWNTFQKNN